MQQEHKKGDLVHIPQAVQLVECATPLAQIAARTQLTIPLSVKITESPQLGVVTEVEAPGTCVRVYADGTHWTVKKENVYTLTSGDQL